MRPEVVRLCALLALVAAGAVAIELAAPPPSEPPYVGEGLVFVGKFLFVVVSTVAVCANLFVAFPAKVVRTS